MVTGEEGTPCLVLCRFFAIRQSQHNDPYLSSLRWVQRSVLYDGKRSIVHLLGQ